MAGRRSGLGRPLGGRRPGRLHQRFALRAGEGRRTRPARGPTCDRSGSRPGLRQHGGRPGRAGLRRRLPRGRRRRCGADSGSAVGAGAAGDRPRPARSELGQRRSGRCGRRHDHAGRAGHALRLPRGCLRAGRAPGRRGPRPGGGGLGRTRHGDPRLRAQEPLPLGRARTVRGHRLRPGRDPRLRRARARGGARRRHAEQVVERALGHRRAGPRRAPGPALVGHSDRPDGQGLARVGRADRPRGREPAGAGPWHDPHGAVEPVGAPRADHRQQERGSDRVLHSLRRFRRRVRAHQGRAEVTGVAAVPLAERHRRRAG